MPNRLIKDSLRISKKVNGLSDFNFRIWVYLITYVDDYGRGSADPELLKGLVFPRRAGLTEAQISRALDDLANNGMIALYEYEGEPYFYFPNWDKHQQIRTRKSKFPDPCSCDCDNLKSFEIIRNQTISNESKCFRNPIQSESESESKSESSDARASEACGRIVSFYENGAGTVASPYFGEVLPHFVSVLGEDVVKHGIEAAFLEGKTTPRYILAILQRYEKEKLTTLEDVLRSERKFELERAGNKGRGNRGSSGRALKPEEYSPGFLEEEGTEPK